METANANIVGGFQERLKRLIADAEQLAMNITAAYPTSDVVTDRIDLAVLDLKDASTMFETYDPDEPAEDDDSVESEVG